MSMERKFKILFVILLCICLNQLVLGQNNLSSQPVSGVAVSKTAAALPSPSEKSSFEALAAFTQFAQEDPLLLLLCGMMLFAGATTLRRKMSRRREQAPNSINTPV